MGEVLPQLIHMSHVFSLACFLHNSVVDDRKKKTTAGDSTLRHMVCSGGITIILEVYGHDNRNLS